MVTETIVKDVVAASATIVFVAISVWMMVALFRGSARAWADFDRTSSASSRVTPAAWQLQMPMDERWVGRLARVLPAHCRQRSVDELIEFLQTLAEDGAGRWRRAITVAGFLPAVLRVRWDERGAPGPRPAHAGSETDFESMAGGSFEEQVVEMVARQQAEIDELRGRWVVHTCQDDIHVRFPNSERVLTTEFKSLKRPR
jgi:hypothetical protein